MSSAGTASKSQQKAPGRFSRLASGAASIVGSPWAFIFAIGSTVVWGILGPRYHYSDTWQLVMNSFTNLFTFLIVFLIQHTQLRDSRAINLKLDEIVRGVSGAENDLIDVEKVSDQELDRLEHRYERIRREVMARRKRHGQPGTAA
jgi:low affinity Fe/Cu permease